MDSKSLIWIGMFVGSTIGSFLPSLWGAGVFSMSAIIFSAIGGLAGIWLGYEISR